MLLNTLDFPLRVVLDLKAVPELKGSKNTSQARGFQRFLKTLLGFLKNAKSQKHLLGTACL